MVKYSETSCESSYDGNVICKFKWNIIDFLSIKEEYVNSPKFSACDCDDTEWYISVYPNDKIKDSVAVTIYLFLSSSKKTEITADFTLSVLNDDGEPNVHKKKTTATFERAATGRGFEAVKRADLLDKSENYLSNGNLIVSCEIILKGGPINQTDRAQSKKRSENLGKMLYSSKYADMSLQIGNKAVKVHKVLLASMSSVFADMIDKDNSNNKLTVTDVDFEVMAEVLEFIYTGKASKLNEMAKKLLVAAEKFALVDLKELCENALCEQLTIENACDTLIFFDAQSCNRSKQKVRNFISENVTEVMKTKGFTQMTQPHLIKLIMKTLAARVN